MLRKLRLSDLAYRFGGAGAGARSIPYLECRAHDKTELQPKDARGGGGGVNGSAQP